MSVQTNGEQGQEPAAGTQGQGQEPAQQNGQHGTQGQEPGTNGTPPTFDLSAIQDPALRGYLEHQQTELAKVRQEAAQYRTKARDLETAAQQAARANETEQERLAREQQERETRLQALEQENRDLKVGTALRDAAGKAGALSAQAVWDLVRGRGITVETDDKGVPTNVDAILSSLRESDPYLFRRTVAGADGGAGAGAGNGGAPVTGINEFIRGRGRATAR